MKAWLFLKLRMFHRDVRIKEGSVFIADVHYKKGDKEFLDLLDSWIKDPPPQVFLLGDIFHLLLPFDYLISYNKEAIDKINLLSKKTSIYYTPGNHDFNITSIFPNVIFADAFVDKEKSIFLTHGDLTDDDKSYKIYSKIIRNRVVEDLCHIVSFNFLNSWLFKKLLKKPIKCTKIKNFQKIVKKKLKLYDYDIIIEGHYHQNEKIENYINLPSYYCEGKYMKFIKNSLKEVDGR